MLGQYAAIRTIGCSAGAFVAVIAGYRLGAELAVSVAGPLSRRTLPDKNPGTSFDHVAYGKALQSDTRPDVLPSRQGQVS